MAEPLKNAFDRRLVRRIADEIHAVHPPFDTKRFLADACRGLDELELLGRARQVARALAAALPPAFPAAAAVLVRSLGARLPRTEGSGMEVFRYWPHVIYAAEAGIEHFEEALALQYELTQRFTAEFSIRAFLDRYPDATLERLSVWARDPNEHVRRLVSEGTRPRLPWAPRLSTLRRAPERAVPLLELLKDDPSPYVRRSVANHLNDLCKEAPELALDVAARWMADAPPERARLVRHGLRTLTRVQHPKALALLGHGPEAKVDATLRFSPRRLPLGGVLTVAVTVTSHARTSAEVLCDLRVHFVKARGEARPKTFRVKRATLAAGETWELEKRISFEPLTTRKAYPGRHVVELVVNGHVVATGAVTVHA